MPVNSAQINHIRNQIKTLPTSKWIDEYAKYNAEEVFPVLIAMLNDIHQQLSIQQPQTPAILNTKQFTQHAIKILDEAHKRREGMNVFNIWNVASIVKEVSKQRIESELVLMVSFARQIEITQNTVALWHELGCALEGLYKRIYDKIPKEKNGELVRNANGAIDPVDFKDTIFQSLFQMTKFDVVSYYHQAYQAINAKLNEFNAKHAVKNEQVVPQTLVHEFRRMRM